jgi:hypothetical protein
MSQTVPDITQIAGLLPVPGVEFAKIHTYAVPRDAEDLIVVSYRPVAAEGWLLANCWHEQPGIITAVLRRVDAI